MKSIAKRAVLQKKFHLCKNYNDKTSELKILKLKNE